MTDEEKKKKNVHLVNWCLAVLSQIAFPSLLPGCKYWFSVGELFYVCK